MRAIIAHHYSVVEGAKRRPASRSPSVWQSSFVLLFCQILGCQILGIERKNTY
jgi:hypothetical protein